MSVWVKICGLTRPEDVVAAIAAGADAVGLNLVARSPRRIDAPRAAELAAVAKGRVEVVVLVEGDAPDAVAMARRIGADSVQPYGPDAAEIAAAARAAGLGVIMPVPVDDGELAIDLVPPGARPLLDTAVDGLSGGTGTTFDWDRGLAAPDAIIAGGLDAANVAAAIRASGAVGVDASSGLEAAVGIKDTSKVVAFIAAARAAVEDVDR